MWEPRNPQPPTTRTDPRDLSGGLSSEAIGRGKDKRRRVNGRWKLLLVMGGAELRASSKLDAIRKFLAS